MSVEDTNKFLRKKYKIAFDPLVISGPNCEGKSFEMVHDKLGKQATWIWTREYKPNDPWWMQTLTHEISHACTGMLVWKGFDMSNEANEPLAYQIGSLTRIALIGAKNYKDKK